MMDRRKLFALSGAAVVAGPAAADGGHLPVRVDDQAPVRRGYGVAGRRRLSTEKGDPGYRLYGMCMGDKKKVQVFFNGQESRCCVTADEAEGFIKIIVETPEGNIAHVNGDVLTEVLRGHVEVVIT